MADFEKQVAEVLDYDFDFTKFFRTIPTDSIQSVSVEATVTDGALELGPSPHPSAIPIGKKVKVWLGAGTDGQTYELSLKVTTAEGRVAEQDFSIKVTD